MKISWKSIAILVLLLSSMAAVTACEQSASNFTDNMINNMEEEVGGAAERSSQNAGQQAGGQICGAPLALVFLPFSASIFLVIRRGESSVSRRNTRNGSQSNSQKDSQSKTAYKGGK